jgi:hypothetical protein
MKHDRSPAMPSLFSEFALARCAAALLIAAGGFVLASCAAEPVQYGSLSAYDPQGPGRVPSNGLAWALQDEVAKLSLEEPAPGRYVQRVDLHLEPTRFDASFLDFVGGQMGDGVENWRRATQPRPHVRDWDGFTSRPAYQR